MNATVYAHIDADDDVLYVGCAGDIEKRSREHRRMSGWWDRVVTVEVASPPMPKKDARELERRLIETFDPPYNVEHGTGRTFRTERPRRRVTRTPSQRLADALLPDGLDAFVASRRPAASWRRIALDLRDATANAVDVTPESLRSWYADQTERVA